MMSKHVQNPEVSDEAVSSALDAAKARAARRKFLFGGAVATPAMVILASRPVLGQGVACTASAQMSASLSRPCVPQTQKPVG